ncbi:MAG: hypothetical protein LBI34_03980 [Puniceicoccales bacterium]|jgi:hypothetical protein|nr:hypothetical protein [Puniceicoccales bacterium]
MLLPILDVWPKSVVQVHPEPVRASELQALYNPSFQTGRALFNLSKGVPALGIATILLGGIGPELAAIVLVCTILTASGVGISALLLMFHSPTTCTRDNVRKLCDYCHTHHPNEFATFLRFSKLSQIVKVNCDSVGGGSKQEQKDSAVLNSLIAFLKSDIFTPTERAEAARHTRVCGDYGCDRMRITASPTVVDDPIDTGATEPVIELIKGIKFQNALFHSYYTGGRGAIVQATVDKTVTRVLQLISGLPANLAVEILNYKCESGNPDRAAYYPSFAMSVVRYCINPEVVELLLATLQKLPEEQRNEILTKTTSSSVSLARCLTQIPEGIRKKFKFLN